MTKHSPVDDKTDEETVLIGNLDQFNRVCDDPEMLTQLRCLKIRGLHEPIDELLERVGEFENLVTLDFAY